MNLLYNIANDFRYDCHIIMEAIGGQSKNKRIDCIPNNMERYISFRMGSLVFLDTLQFLNTSLEQLVNNLSVNGADKFPHTSDYMRRKYPDLLPDAITLILKKGVYPYDYMDSYDRFDESSLPPKEEFYNSLSEEHITDAEYQHAQNVWKTFDIKTMGQYHDLYMETGEKLYLRRNIHINNTYK